MINDYNQRFDKNIKKNREENISIMSTYIDSLIIFILCSLLFPASMFDALHITCILLMFALFCFITVAKNKKLLMSLGILILPATFAIPEMCAYLPLFYYMYFYRKQYIIPIMYIIPIANWLFTDNLPSNWLIVPLIALGWYLSYQTTKSLELQNTLIISRDDSVEHEIILKEKNRQLLENQDDQIYIATLKERNRIAREIHDNVGHMLSRSILQVGAMLAICKDETLQPHLTTLKETLDTAMNSIRNSVHDLHDESVDLKNALENLIENFTFCDVQLDCEISKHIPKEVKYCFLAITKEALNNTMKHSNATKVTVTVKEHPAFYQLLIEDNGTQKKTESATADTAGIGLSNMKERVENLHGIIHINTENGFRIFVSIQK